MFGTEGVGAAQIDQDRALAYRAGGLHRIDGLHAGVAGREAEQRRPLLVDPLHPLEVRRRLGQIREHRGDEGLARAVLQRRVEAPLRSDGRVRRGADAGAAKRSRAVARMHLDRVVQREQFLEQRIVQLAGKLPRLRFAEQIGTADGADEERVAGEHARRLAALARDDGDVLRRVPGRVTALEVGDRRTSTARRRGLRGTRNPARRPGPRWSARRPPSAPARPTRSPHECGFPGPRRCAARAAWRRRRRRRRRAAGRSRSPHASGRRRSDRKPGRAPRRRSAETSDKIPAALVCRIIASAR